MCEIIISDPPYQTGSKILDRWAAKATRVAERRQQLRAIRNQLAHNNYWAAASYPMRRIEYSDDIIWSPITTNYDALLNWMTIPAALYHRASTEDFFDIDIGFSYAPIHSAADSLLNGHTFKLATEEWHESSIDFAINLANHLEDHRVKSQKDIWVLWDALYGVPHEITRVAQYERLHHIGDLILPRHWRATHDDMNLELGLSQRQSKVLFDNLVAELRAYDAEDGTVYDLIIKFREKLLRHALPNIRVVAFWISRVISQEQFVATTLIWVKIRRICTGKSPPINSVWCQLASKQKPLFDHRRYSSALLSRHARPRLNGWSHSPLHSSGSRNAGSSQARYFGRGRNAAGLPFGWAWQNCKETWSETSAVQHSRIRPVVDTVQLGTR